VKLWYRQPEYAAMERKTRRELPKATGESDSCEVHNFVNFIPLSKQGVLF